MSDGNDNIVKLSSAGAAGPLDELVLHRYLEGRLDSKERANVDELLRSNAAARRTLDALREEQTLIREAFETRVEPAHRIADKVLFTLYSEERKRQQVIRNRRWRRQISIGFGIEPPWRCASSSSVPATPRAWPNRAPSPVSSPAAANAAR